VLELIVLLIRTNGFDSGGVTKYPVASNVVFLMTLLQMTGKTTFALLVLLLSPHNRSALQGHSKNYK